MTKEEILEANKLFAKYLGYKYFPRIDGETRPGWRKEIVVKGNGYLCRTHNQLPFYKDWNWMMKVWVKSNLFNSNALLNGDAEGFFKQLYEYLKRLENE